MRVLLGRASNVRGEGFDSPAAGCQKEAVVTPRERIISEKSDLFLLMWLGKQDYTLNMFHNANCSIIAMVLREMDDWVRHALLRRTGVFIVRW